jgi:hypothetical protein
MARSPAQLSAPLVDSDNLTLSCTPDLLRILDHSPALELLQDGDGVAGATGVQQRTGQRWTVIAGSVGSPPAAARSSARRSAATCSRAMAA